MRDATETEMSMWSNELPRDRDEFSAAHSQTSSLVLVDPSESRGNKFD